MASVPNASFPHLPPHCRPVRFGRKFAFIFTLVALFSSATSPIFTTNYYAFLASQALNGAAFPSSIFLVLVLGIEFMPPQQRSNVLLFSWLAFHFGEWITFLLAETVSHWVWIAAFNSACVFPCLLLVLFSVDESPHWILANSKDSVRLRKLFEKLNQVNGAKMDSDSLNSIVSVSTQCTQMLSVKK